MLTLSQRLGELPASNLAWLMTSLWTAGVAPNHSLLQAAGSLVERQQQEDGRWISEDGPEWDLHSTLEAIRALHACGKLSAL